MKKPVLLTIVSTQQFEDDPPETTELVTEGLLSLEEEALELSYAESELTGLQGTQTCFRIEKDRVLLSRRGTVESHMTFIEGQEDLSLYDMGYGALMICVRTERIQCTMGENGGLLLVSYGIVIEEEAHGSITYEISVQPLPERR